MYSIIIIITGKEVVSSGMKWSVEVNQDESVLPESSLPDEVDWLTGVPPTEPPVIKLVPSSALLSDHVVSSSGSNSVQQSNITSASSGSESAWRENTGFQSPTPNLGSILDSVNTVRLFFCIFFYLYVMNIFH